MEQLLQPVASAIGMPVWVIKAFAIILTALVVEVVFRFVINRLHSLAERSNHMWDDAVVYAGMRPISLLIWWQGLVMAARVVPEEAGVVVLSSGILTSTQQVGLIVAATWFFFRLATGFERAFVDQRRKRELHVDLTAVTVLGRIVRIAVVLTGVLTLLAVLNIPISGFLAAGGVGGIAVGLAARDMIANFFGGFMVFMDRPFSVGDWVRSPDREIEGVVEKLGWRVTVIRTFDKRPLYVPNATFTVITLENPARMTHRRIFDHVGVRYDDFDKVRPIVDAVQEMLSQHEDIDTDQTLMVRFDAFGASSLDIMVYCFTRTVNWIEYHRVREDVLLRIGAIIEEHDAQVAFPTRTLKLDMAERQALEAGMTGPVAGNGQADDGDQDEADGESQSRDD